VVRRPQAHSALDPQPVPRHEQCPSPDPRCRLWHRNHADPPRAIRRCAGRRHGPGSGRLLPRARVATGVAVGRRQPAFRKGHIRSDHSPRRRRAHRRRPRRSTGNEAGLEAGRAVASDRARIQVLVGPPGRHQSAQAPLCCSPAAQPPAVCGLRGAEADVHERDSVSGHRRDPARTPCPTGAAEARV